MWFIKLAQNAERINYLTGVAFTGVRLLLSAHYLDLDWMDCEISHNYNPRAIKAVDSCGWKGGLPSITMRFKFMNFKWSPQLIMCFHLALSSALSSVSTTNYIPSFTTSTNILFGLSFFFFNLQLSCSIATMYLLMYSLSVLYASELSVSSLRWLISATSNFGCSFDVFIFNANHPCHSQRKS